MESGESRAIWITIPGLTVPEIGELCFRYMALYHIQPQPGSRPFTKRNYHYFGNEAVDQSRDGSMIIVVPARNPSQACGVSGDGSVCGEAEVYTKSKRATVCDVREASSPETPSISTETCDTLAAVVTLG